MFAVLGGLASSAAANSVNPLTVNDCSSVTFNYIGFPNKPNNTTSETLKINGSVVATKTAHFNGPSGSDTVPFTGGKNGDKLVASAAWNTNGAVGSFTSAPQTLMGCAVTYTGRAYDASATLKIGTFVNQLIGPIGDTGPVSTTATTDKTNSVIPVFGTPITAFLLNTTQKTGANSSMFGAQVGFESISGLGLPTITSNQVTATSTSKCGAAPSGTTNILFLQIGSTVVVGPGGIPSGPIPKNTTLTIPNVGTVVLNEQTPIPGGLSVNAIDITVPSLGGFLSTKVIVSHAESDIEGC
jgi:hypothetical protein